MAVQQGLGFVARLCGALGGLGLAASCLCANRCAHRTGALAEAQEEEQASKAPRHVPTATPSGGCIGRPTDIGEEINLRALGAPNQDTEQAETFVPFAEQDRVFRQCLVEHRAVAAQRAAEQRLAFAGLLSGRLGSEVTLSEDLIDDIAEHVGTLHSRVTAAQPDLPPAPAAPAAPTKTCDHACTVAPLGLRHCSKLCNDRFRMRRLRFEKLTSREWVEWRMAYGLPDHHD
eukprot:COSAG04_NODE_1043_length_8583_cov_3.464757_10_plen_231_part_00